MKTHPHSVILAFDIGGTKIAAAVFSTKTHRLIREKIIAFPKNPSPSLWMRHLKNLGKTMFSSSDSLQSIGIACAGPLDSKKGLLLDPTNFSQSDPNWKRVALLAPMRRYFKVPCFLENDAVCALLGACWKGALQKTSHALMITLGTGVGLAILHDGTVFRSISSRAPEGGHMLLSPFYSPPCACQNTGCAEALLSGKSFFKTIKKVFKLKHIPDPSCLNALTQNYPLQMKKLFQTYSQHLAQLFYNYTLLFAPKKILLSGSWMQASAYFLPQTKQFFKKYCQRFRGPKPLPKILLSKLGPRAPLWGAAYLAIFHRNDSKLKLRSSL